MSKFKLGLREYPWESMRTPEERREDEDRQQHEDGDCSGPPDCFLCQEEKERLEEQEREEITKRANERTKELMDLFRLAGVKF